jgi:threonine/homoserine/homoserine lactone efflux protein
MLKAYTLALGWVTLSQILPGPNLLAVIGTACGQGRRAAVFVALGVATAIFFWVALAAFGLAALFAEFPSLLAFLKVVGGAYLCYLAIKAFARASRRRRQVFAADTTNWSVFAAWRHGLAVNLTNPKSAMMWAAVATFLFSSGLTAFQVFAFAPIGFGTALVIYGSYALLFSSDTAGNMYHRAGWLVEAAFGIFLGLLGLNLLFDELSLPSAWLPATGR